MNIYSEDKMYESYSSEVERMQKCIDELQQENKQIKIQISAREEVCDRLEEENKKYKEVIDKAIEFLKLAQESGLISISTLMKILEGEDNNE